MNNFWYIQISKTIFHNPSKSLTSFSFKDLKFLCKEDTVFIKVMVNCNSSIRQYGSGALPGLMLNLGLLNIICRSFFPSLKRQWGPLTLQGPILILFLTLWDKANLSLT